MMLNVAKMAKDLHLLPSQVESQATTYDLMVLDVYSTYTNYQTAKNNPSAAVERNYYSQDQLQEILNSNNKEEEE
jgi:hypothetical protein